MNTQPIVHLTFETSAREALGFYADVFGGTVQVTTFGDFGIQMAGADYTDRVMYGHVEADGATVLMASDLRPELELHPGNNVAVSMGEADAATLYERWDKLSAGGTVIVPMEKQMWGDAYGLCVDRFGITWHINIAEGA